MPGAKKPYAKDIRGSLIAPDGYELCGSDMSALEDITKQHYIYPLDPEYVKTMMEDGYCPHVDIAKLAGLISEDEEMRYRTNSFIDKDDENHIKAQRTFAKPINHGSCYGQKPKGLSKSAGMPLKQAEELYNIYWKRNWAVREVPKSLKRKTLDDGSMWQLNPVSKLWYSLRGMNDSFSTLNQGTGAYCFDMWVKKCREKGRKMTGSFHDEIITAIPIGTRAECEKDLRDAIKEVNDDLKLNRNLDIDMDFGSCYADIH